MSLFARLFNGLTESTPQQIQLDAGAFFKNFDPKTDTYADAKTAGKCLGATQGGGTITIKPTFRQISVDGAFGRVKGLADVGTWECSISATLIETTAENLRLGIGVASIEKSTTPTGYNIIKGKSGIEDSDFVDNITWIGKLAGSDKPLMFIIKNGLNEDGLSYQVQDENEGKIGVTFYGYNDLADFVSAEVNPPFELYIPEVTP